MDRLISLKAACVALAIAVSPVLAFAQQSSFESGPGASDTPPPPWARHAEPAPEYAPPPWARQSDFVAEQAVAARPDDQPVAARPVQVRARKPQSGKASYYANRFHGRKTASGHPYRKDAYTAAHRTLPLGTWVRVTNTRNDRSVVVQITDRGPYARHRIIDLSRAAATDIGMIHNGIAPVRLEVVQAYAKASNDLKLASSEP